LNLDDETSMCLRTWTQSACHPVNTPPISLMWAAILRIEKEKPASSAFGAGMLDNVRDRIPASVRRRAAG
jgi:hypothetical protein